MQIDKFGKEIIELIPNDIDFKFNGKTYPKHQLVLSHLISDYHKAYLKSFENEKKERTNTLESLGKGNIKRKKRFDKNQKTIKNKDSLLEEKLIALYENLILKRIIKGDYKFAYLILTYLFIHQTRVHKELNKMFLFNKIHKIAFNSLYEALKFFEFTYLSPSKIVNSCAIALNQYIKIHLPNISEEERLKFVRSIINVHFSKHAPSSLRADLFEKEIYCAGLYNGTPIFQWYTSTKKNSYYSQNEIKKYFRIFTSLRKDLGIASKLITNKFVKKDQRKIAEEYFTNINKFEEVIKNTSIVYVQQPNKLIKYLDENYQKTFKDYIKLPKEALNTIFTALITKLTLK